MMTEKEREHFDSVLEAILDRLPDEVAELLDEISLIVEDEPSLELLQDVGPELGLPAEMMEGKDLADLCGLHWGIPLDERSVSESRLVPDHIYLFRGPIQRLAGRSKRELRNQIRITVLHELAHHFGMEEEKLQALGYD